MPLTTGQIQQGDCIEAMRQLDAGTIDLVFADPPFNIGYEYDEYHDRHDDAVYIDWSRRWIDQVHRVLKPSGTFWLAIGDEYAAELKVAAQEIGFTTRSWVVWYYTFGVNCKHKFSRSHAHLFHFLKDEADFTFNADDPAVRIPSARALVYGDKRANPLGRLPDDTWILRPQDFQGDKYGFDPLDDTWYFARVAGTFKERQGFHGCQMPEQLLARIIRVSSNPGDVVLDPFAGSGTTLAVAKKLGRQWLGLELSADYVEAATERLGGIQPGDAIDGPADPIASAPSTANGRRLAHLVDAVPSLAPACPAAALAATNGTHAPASPSNRIEPEPAARPPRITQLESTPSIVENSPPAPPRLAKREVRDVLREAIVEAFFATHEGYSIDWLLAEPALQAAYHDACRNTGLIGGPLDWNRELLRLRKTGGFPKRGAIKRADVSADDLENCGFGAEIAWRLTSDKFQGASLDEILCDPAKVAYFDQKARSYAPGFAPALYRWAALRLRKASHALAKNVQTFDYVVANRDFPSRPKSWHACRFSRYQGQTGIYALHDADRRPLFIDLARNLGARLEQHAECKPLARQVEYISIIPPEDLRRCANYEEELKVDLVRRYEPLLNFDLMNMTQGRSDEHHEPAASARLTASLAPA